MHPKRVGGESMEECDGDEENGGQLSLVTENKRDDERQRDDCLKIELNHRLKISEFKNFKKLELSWGGLGSKVC